MHTTHRIQLNITKLTELITKGELLHHAGEEKENDEFPPSPPPEAEETNSFAVSGM
jgi:hypothetical protein